jgi:xanthine dehydrogenase accessory factor
MDAPAVERTVPIPARVSGERGCTRMQDGDSWQAGDARRLYALLAEMAAQGEPGAVATVIRTSRSAPRHSGSKMVIRADGRVAGSVGGGTVEARVIEAARQVMADGQCQRLQLDLDGDAGVCGGETEIFIEPVTDTVPFWVIGAGHVGRAILDLGASLSFRFTVVDDRPEFLTGLQPIDTLHLKPSELVERFRPTPRTIVLLVNRNHELDGEYLDALLQAEQAARQEVAYLGVVGSRTKAKVLAQRFQDRPELTERFARIRIPTGLCIGAETPPEIAMSILAEILAEVREVDRLEDSGGEVLGIYTQRRRPDRRGSRS